MVARDNQARSPWDYAAALVEEEAAARQAAIAAVAATPVVLPPAGEVTADDLRTALVTLGLAASLAGPGLVGYRGDPDDLTVLNPGASFAGTALDGTASSWDGNTLEVRGNNIVFDHYRINAGVIFVSGTNPTVRHCRIQPPAGQIYCLTHSASNGGTLTVEDTTVVGTPDLGTLDYQVDGISSDNRLVARRCDISGSGDGIHAVAQPGAGFDDGSIIEQCYIHDLAFVDPDQHLDGIQIFQQQSVQTFIKIYGCRIDAALGPSGEAMSSSATMGMPPSHNNEALLAAHVENNRFSAGAFHLRFGYRMHNIVCIGNNLGTLNPGAGEFGLASVDVSGSVATWTNNVDGNGNIIANPNP